MNTKTAAHRPQNKPQLKASPYAVMIRRRVAQNGKPTNRMDVHTLLNRLGACKAEYIRTFSSGHRPSARHREEAREEIKELLGRTHTFVQWLAVFDENIGKMNMRRFASAKARELATEPVQLLELYFRTDNVAEERALIQKIKRKKAPPEAWLAFLLRSEPSKLTAFVVARRVSQETLLKWHAEAVDGEKVLLAGHLGLRREIFGKREK